jgi:formylglycine-generating enzyme required for sulfatase activity
LIVTTGLAAQSSAQTLTAGMGLVPAADSGLAYDFYIDQYELSLNPSSGVPQSADSVMPLGAQSWEDAMAACGTRGLRLPTLQEWHAAADGTPDSATDCNTTSGSVRATGPATSACVSRYGMYDMVGNLGEAVDIRYNYANSVLSNVSIMGALDENWQGATAASYNGKTWLGPAGEVVRPITKWDAEIAFPATSGADVNIDDGSYHQVGSFTNYSMWRGGSFSHGAEAGRYNTNNWTGNAGLNALGFRCAVASGRPRLAILNFRGDGKTGFTVAGGVTIDYTASPTSFANLNIDFYSRRGTSANCADRTLTGWTKLTASSLHAADGQYVWDTTASLAGGPGHHHICTTVSDGTNTSYYPSVAVRVGPEGYCLMEDSKWATSTTGCKFLVAGKSATNKSFSHTADQINWQAANSYCAALTEGGAAAGTWRLPTKQELVDISSANGAATHLNAMPKVRPFRYWTSTATGKKHTSVNLETGATDSPGDTYTRFVVCTR